MRTPLKRGHGMGRADQWTGWSSPSARSVFIVAFVTIVILVAFQTAVRDQADAVPWMALPPLVASVFLTWRWVVGVGGASLVGSFVYLWILHGFDASSALGQTMDFLVVCAAIVISVAVAVVRERDDDRLRRLTQLASVVQQAILRPIDSRLGPFDIAARYVSARSGAEIGGDLYEALDTEFGVRIIIGDVRGKGLDAVRLSSTVLGSYRHVAFERSDQRCMVNDLDHAVARNADEEDFVTAILMQERGGTLEIVNCGHPPPMLVRGGVASYLEPESMAPPLGLGPSARELTVRLQPGDRIFLYTDGLAEARNDGEFFPIRDRAWSLIGHGNVGDGLASLETALRRWVGGPLTDDIALLLLDYRPEAD
ncbi:serine/threonine-protein phosphatase [Glycomyces sp. L485]|uniref:PP2C family protein-serine/threonine phosphatase n=1 Tax=Glycomyces sp. L485 TaxID=2909235 RepID=UPI001F4B2241|nr:PP2C family protein-serine/threonine phosphatase [Glycomyces sp. L485]MCH7232084.1 serine/threonine-protein phosphatase [Glycomyces sp. L485]